MEMGSSVPQPGSVARKIALFQVYESGNHGSGTGTGRGRLRRKDGIKRKKPTNGKVGLEGDTGLDLDMSDCSSICAGSTVSSDSCYGGSVGPERQRFPLERIRVHRSSDELNLISARTTSSVQTYQRNLKDCYQSFTLPRRPGQMSLQLVEFTSEQFLETENLLEKSTVVADAYYEELDGIQRSSSPRSRFQNDDDVRPPSPPPYESIYAEPIYGDTGSSGSSSYWSPSSSIYSNNGPASTSHNVLLNNTSITPRVTLTPFDQPALQLPPLPNPTPQAKFSSIAKSAGRKIAKKLDIIRRLSRTSSMDGSGLSLSMSPSPVPMSRTNQANSLYNVSQSSSLSQSQGSVTPGQQCEGKNEISNQPVAVKRQVLRPRIPPPEPPPPRTCTLDRKGQEVKSRRNQNRNSFEPPDYETRVKFETEDFEDSDFCDSDSELIRNFVSAVQPIYSMEEEPLYQYYTYGISLQPEDDYQPIIPKNLGLTLEMLIPRQGQRTLWCQIPEVSSSGILEILSDKQKQLQESIFEVLTSEVSYLKSLDVLVSLFYENEDLNHLLTEVDRAALFGNIKAVKESSSLFLKELLGKWDESWYIHEVGNLIRVCAENRFRVYVEYCRNKPYQDRTVQQLRSTSDEFSSVIKSIEEDPKCENLRMDSFLMLPMQRITRLPLLVNAIIQRTQNHNEKCECEEALKSLTNLVIECNDAARESQDFEESARILEKLDFHRGVLFRQSRNPGQFLLKGDFMKNPFETGRGATRINWTFQKAKKTYYCIILFTHELFITKKRSCGKLEVVDTATPKDVYIKGLPTLEGISKDFQHYFMLHFEGRDTVYFLAGRTQSEVDRWRLKLDQVRALKDLRVTAIFDYVAERDDELSFTAGQVIQVSQKQPDGWFYGSKENGDEGWFPGNYAE